MKKFTDFWKKQANRAIEVQLTVILILVYFIFMAPVGIYYRITQKLFTKKNIQSNWLDWTFNNCNEEIKQM